MKQEQENNSPELICANDPKTNNSIWEAAHKRVTFYCHKELLGKLNKLSSSVGISKSKLIVEGIELVIADKSVITSKD